MNFEEYLGGLLKNALESGSPAAFVLVFFLGALVSLTPCVYPVIPLIVGYIGGISGGRKLNGFIFSVAYVAGMALVYSALGVAAALFGGLVGQSFGNAWVLFAIANVIIFMALWMLGLFEIPLPDFLAGRKTANSRRGGLVGSFLIGASSALIVGPCSTPALALILGLISASSEQVHFLGVAYGAALMFIYALGMGMLLIVCGTFSAALASLPKSGRWLGAVKKAFGIILILFAEFLLLRAGRLPPFSDWL